MKRILISGLMFLIVIEVMAQGKELTADYITENLQRRYEMIDDANVQFEQHVRFGFSAVEQNIRGTLMMKKPNRYRIESGHQTIVTDGATVWAYSKTNNQIIIDNYRENGNTISPEKFMLNLPVNYYATVTGSEKTPEGIIVQLKLVPKDDRSFIKSVKLTVEEHGWLVRKIVILDINETETAYIVKDIKLNTNIKEKAFVFDKPEGVEVVDLR